RPNIKLNQIQSQRRDEAEFLIVFANRSSIRNPGEDNADHRPPDKEESGSAVLNLEVHHEDRPGLYQTRLSSAHPSRMNVVSSRENGVNSPDGGAISTRPKRC